MYRKNKGPFKKREDPKGRETILSREAGKLLNTLALRLGYERLEPGGRNSICRIRTGHGQLRAARARGAGKSAAPAGESVGIAGKQSRTADRSRRDSKRHLGRGHLCRFRPGAELLYPPDPHGSAGRFRTSQFCGNLTPAGVPLHRGGHSHCERVRSESAGGITAVI